MRKNNDLGFFNLLPFPRALLPYKTNMVKEAFISITLFLLNEYTDI